MDNPAVEEKMENAVQVDAALEYLNHEDATLMTTIDERKLVRKIDWMIVPCRLPASIEYPRKLTLFTQTHVVLLQPTVSRQNSQYVNAV